MSRTTRWRAGAWWVHHLQTGVQILKLLSLILNSEPQDSSSQVQVLRNRHRWFILYFKIPDEVSSSDFVMWIAKNGRGHFTRHKREPALVPILTGHMIGRCGTPAFTAFWQCGGFLFFLLLKQLVHHTSHFGFPPRRKSKMVWAFGAHPGVYPAILTAQILQQPRVI